MKRLKEELIKETLKPYIGSEELLALGWATKGMKGYFIGVTKENLYILSVSSFYKPKTLRTIPLKNLEAYSPSGGHGDVPMWMKLNLDSQLLDLLTATLIIKEKEKPLEYYKFNRVIGYWKNPSNAFKIAQVIHTYHPEIPTEIPRSIKKKSPFWKRFLYSALICFLFFEPFMIWVAGDYTFSTISAITVGVLIASVIVGLVFAPFIPIFRRIITGHD